MFSLPSSTSTVYTHSNQESDVSSKVPNSKYYENGSDISTDESEYPQPKKRKLQKTSLSTPSSPTYITSTQGGLHSSNEKYEPQLITSTAQTKRKHKTSKQQSQKTKPSASQQQIDSLESGSISLQEFLNLYNDIPHKFRSKKFYKACKTYLHNVAKTKTSVQEKKALFLSLPQSLKTSFSLFELMFKEESIILSNIASGKIDVCNLQNNIDMLSTFFSQSYIRRQITLFVKHKQNLSSQEKYTISECRKNLRQLEKQSKCLLRSNEKTFSATTNKLHENDTNPSNDDQQTQKQIHKQKLPPEAKEILDALASETIDSNDIVSSRQKLVLLRVDRQIIRRAFDAFKNKVAVSQRSDKDYVLYQLNEAVCQTSTMQVNRLPFSNRLQHLYDQALSGILPLHCINELRDLLFKENTTVRASASFGTAKKALIRHNKDRADEIQEAFEQSYTLSSTLSNTCKHLQTKIKEGNLKTTEFTSIYNSILQSDKTGTLSRMCSQYIKSQLKNITSFNDKIKLLKELPQPLQKSYSNISLIFPHEGDIISSIRNGKLPSSEVRNHFMQLLQIIDITHMQNIIQQYVAIKKHLTPDEEIDISKCRSTLRQLLQTPQSTIDTHTVGSSKSKYQQQEDTTSKANKPSTSRPIKKLKIQKTFNDMKALRCVKDKENASTSTYQSHKSLIPTTAKHTEISVEHETDEQKQITLMIHSDKQSMSPTPKDSTDINRNTHTSAHNPSSWYTCAQQAYYKVPDIILEHPTDLPMQPTSPQPSTSDTIENSYKTTKSLSLEQMSSDELTYILKSINDEDQYSEDNLLLQQYLINLAQELQQETDTLEQSISQSSEEGSTSKSPSYTETMDIQYTSTYDPILDCELPKVDKDFVDIIDMSKNLNHEDYDQLADSVECTMPLQEMAPEDFFNFSDID